MNEKRERARARSRAGEQARDLGGGGERLAALVLRRVQQRDELLTLVFGVARGNTWTKSSQPVRGAFDMSARARSSQRRFMLSAEP